MSLRATLWALDDAPVENATEVLVLLALADEAADDGRNAFPSIRRVASRARVKKRAAQYALRKLEDAGVIVKGDQSAAAAHIARADRRPTVYDLNLALTWETAGKPRPGSDDGVQDLHPAQEAGRGAIPRPDGVQSGDERGANSPPHGVHAGAPDPKDPNTDPNTDPKSVAADAPPRDLNAGRVDVDRICAHLSQRLIEREVKHDPTTKVWRDAARLMLDVDKRTEEQIHYLIDWTQRHHFWHLNIRSTAKLREQFDRLRDEVLAERKGGGGATVHHLPGTEKQAERHAAYFGGGR